MTPTDKLHRDLSRRLKALKRGPGWLASQMGVNRITLHHFLRRTNKDGGIRNISYSLGVKLSRWLIAKQIKHKIR